MDRLIAKLVLLGAFVMLIFNFYAPNDMAGAWAGSGFVLVMGLISFNKKIAIEGDGDKPGILIMATVALPLGPLVFLYLLPIVLFDYGISNRAPALDRLDIFILALMGFLITLCVWVPFWGYRLVDAVFNAVQRHRA